MVENVVILSKPNDLQCRLREGFSKRLVETLRERGYISSRAAHGVSVKALADALGCSITMSRRYILGESLPENRTMEKLSDWLKVDVWWLLYGNKNQKSDAQFDKALLKEVLLQTQTLLAELPDHWDTLIDDILEIYQNISELQGTKEAKIASIKLMVDFLRKTLPVA